MIYFYPDELVEYGVLEEDLSRLELKAGRRMREAQIVYQNPVLWDLDDYSFMAIDRATEARYMRCKLRKDVFVKLMQKKVIK